MTRDEIARDAQYDSRHAYAWARIYYRNAIAKQPVFKADHTTPERAQRVAARASREARMALGLTEEDYLC